MKAGRFWEALVFISLSTVSEVTLFYLFQSPPSHGVGFGSLLDWISHSKSKLSKRKSTKNREGGLLVHSISDAILNPKCHFGLHC